jgi:hypothetical protein
MDGLKLSADLFAGALIAGACVSALAGNTVEWRWQAVARLGNPVIDPQKPFASLACVAVAGPYLLINEIILAHKERHVGWAFTICALFFASLWCLASGILCLEFLWQIAHLS